MILGERISNWLIWLLLNEKIIFILFIEMQFIFVSQESIGVSNKFNNSYSIK